MRANIEQTFRRAIPFMKQSVAIEGEASHRHSAEQFLEPSRSHHEISVGDLEFLARTCQLFFLKLETLFGADDPLGHLQSGKQIFSIKWFGEKVIHSRIECFEPVGSLAFRAEQNNINVCAALSSNFAAETHTIHLRHHPVGN